MRVLLTHSEGRLGGLAEALTGRGLSVTHYPLIETVLLPRDEVWGDVQRLLEADWLLFTSRTAVQAWGALGLPLNVKRPRLGAVGQKTANDLGRLGGQVSLLAEPENAEGLLQTFLACVSPPGVVGLPGGEQALGTPGSGLAQAGFNVRKAILYRTLARPFPDVQADLIVVASPSAVAALPDAARHAQLVALGPSTAGAVRKRGWCVTESRTPDLPSVVEAVLQAATPLETP